jgi:hypothetical protein
MSPSAIGSISRQNPTELNRNLSSDLNDLIARQAEEIADMNRVALHHREKGFLPGWQPLAVLSAHHGLVTNIIGHIVNSRAIVTP